MNETFGGANFVIVASRLDDMSAFDFAQSAKQAVENLAVVILANESDPEMDLSEQREAGILYLRRPIDAAIFSQVLFAGMRGDDISTCSRNVSRVSAPRYQLLRTIPEA